MASTTMEERLRREPVGKLLLSLAAPAVMAQVVLLLYNFVDRIFLGQTAGGELVIASVGICAPILMVITSVAELFGRGGGPLAGIEMGRGDVEKAERYLGTCCTMLVATSMVLTAVLLVALEPILVLFGASPQTLPDALTYGRIYCAGTVFIQLTIGLNNFIMTQGFSGISMGTTLLGAVLNIALDPVFIFALDMGVAGAAVATVVSQAASFLWIVAFFAGRRTVLRVRRANLVPDWSMVREVAVLGSAPCFMAATEGLLQVCFNRQLLFYGGDIAVGAMTVVFSLGSIAFAPRMGLSQGAQPIISHNYGAGDYGRVRATVRLLFVTVALTTLAASTLLFAMGEPLVALFNPSGDLVPVAVPMLWVYALGGLILSVFIVCQGTYVSLGEGKQSLAFAFLRKIALLIPLMYVLPAVLPIDPVLAVVMAEPAADFVAVAVNLFFFRNFLRKKLA